ncbi:MAG: hypothetical protein HYX78_03275 [Armatimonadetes bacterium]|nr:hypothetical protein [Armatimonadota bacterium]
MRLGIAFRWGLIAALIVATRTAVICTCCEDHWTAGYRSAHYGCTAGPISAGAPNYIGSTPLYRHHDAPFSKNPNYDEDCHRKTDCSYEDVEESLFTCDWSIEKSTGGLFTEVTTISGNCSGATWTTTESFEPNAVYRAKVHVNDTPGDGPYGDDGAVDVTGGMQTLYAPGVTNFTTSANYPVCQSDGRFDFHYDWEADCGSGSTHTAHLDAVTVREKVTYESAYTFFGIHDSGHSATQCFQTGINDPTRNGVPGTDGAMYDYKYMLAVKDDPCESTCVGNQVYQWATGSPTGWQYAPDYNDDTANWQTLATYTITRELVYEDSSWKYRITKTGYTPCTHSVP